MDKPRPCGCKGCRTCLICEENYGLSGRTQVPKNNSYVYCPLCNKAWPGWNLNDWTSHPNHFGEAIDYPGIYIDLNFLTKENEDYLIRHLDQLPWELSQSGRRKQNFGPKCNFKKKKLNVGNFDGFPLFSKFVQDKFMQTPILKDFQTIEQCSLEYDPARGASIDPHIDDCWIWGERIVTVNLLSDSVLTMTYNDKPNKYNVNLVETYPAVLDKENRLKYDNKCYKIVPLEDGKEYPVVRIPMPRRSLLVMFNSARYDWEHQILRDDIWKRRVCIAYREFTPPYLPHGSKSQEGEEILSRARNFWDHLIKA